MRRGCLILLLCAGFAVAQEKTGKLITPEASTEASTANVVTVPSGTKVPLVLRQTIWTKNAREGDSVYAQTNFPVVVDGVVAIPPGTYVQGKITRLQRPGRVKGRAELLVNFTSMIFPSGYTVMLPGAVDNAPDVDGKIKDQEGTVEGSGGKGKDAGTIASTAGAGAGIGGIAAQSGKGAAIGGGVGALAGLASVLFTRGPEIKIDTGTALEMVLERPVSIDRTRTVAKN